MVTIAIVSQKANVLVKCDSENLFASKGLNRVWSLFKKSLKQIQKDSSSKLWIANTHTFL